MYQRAHRSNNQIFVKLASRRMKTMEKMTDVVLELAFKQLGKRESLKANLIDCSRRIVENALLAKSKSTHIQTSIMPMMSLSNANRPLMPLPNTNSPTNPLMTTASNFWSMTTTASAATTTTSAQSSINTDISQGPTGTRNWQYDEDDDNDNNDENAEELERLSEEFVEDGQRANQ